MDDLPSAHAKLSQELSNANLLVTEQRQVIMALGQLVTEMGQTITHYERLLDQAAKLLYGSDNPSSEIVHAQAGR